jgi:tetratricopeptide (TPR) repeat protein/transcriptional regulator with XRE-family HTH domain
MPGAAEAQTLDDLAGLLRALRRRHARHSRSGELTYRELAARTGWSHTAIAEYLTGKTLPPTDRFDGLVGLLGATPAEKGLLATARDRVEENHRRAPRRTTGRAENLVPRQLPADVHAFAGRSDQLARLDALLAGSPDAAPAAVVIAATGTAGVGKTALAVRWAHRVADQFDDGQLYANLRGFDPGGQATAPTDVIRGFLNTLGMSPERIPPSLDAQAALYRSLLAGKRILVVLDNARDAEQVRPLLPGTPTTLVVVTSRSQLAPLVAVDGAYPLNLDPLNHGEARELLTKRLGTDRVSADPAAVEEIISACARLPLALSIAAARAQLSGFPLAVLAAELQRVGERLRVLDAGDPTTEVRTVFSWSYSALTPPAARLFRLLGLHPGPDITMPAAASLAALAAPEVSRLLTELTRANLLDEHSPGRYTFHDLLRAYATDLVQHLDPGDERHAAMTRLFDHYAHTARAADRLLRPHGDPVGHPLTLPAPGASPDYVADHQHAMAWLTAEHSVLLAVLRRAAETGFDRHTWLLALALDAFLDRQGHWLDRAYACQAALDAARRLGDPAAQAVAHRFLAGASTLLGRYPDAHTHLRCALDLYAQVGDWEGQAHTHQNLASLWDRQGHPDKALDHARQTLAMTQAAGHRRGQADALNSVGWCHSQLGDHTQALTYCEQALSLLQQLGDRAGEAATWDSLGYAHHHLGHHAQAVDCYQHALSLIRDLGERYNEAETLTRLGDTHHAAGAPTAARTVWQQALDILTELDHPDAAVVRAKIRGQVGTSDDQMTLTPGAHLGVDLDLLTTGTPSVGDQVR